MTEDIRKRKDMQLTDEQIAEAKASLTLLTDSSERVLFERLPIPERNHDLTGDEVSMDIDNDPVLGSIARYAGVTSKRYPAHKTGESNIAKEIPGEELRIGAGLSREQIIELLLETLTSDNVREGLAETPKRVAKAWAHWTKGYSEDPAAVLKVFEDGAENYDEMVMVKNIPFYSHCEHHLAAIIGTATVAYIPNGKVVGLSKLNRVVDIFARRLQVQERLTSQIADALADNLDAKGVGVVITARHMCMESRGVCQQGHHTLTSALRGAMRDDPATRSEFMALVNK